MREQLSAYEVQECYHRAAEARRIADTAATAAERADLLEVERGWLSLAHSRGSLGQTRESAMALFVRAGTQASHRRP
jgi:hypothetical protein